MADKSMVTRHQPLSSVLLFSDPTGNALDLVPRVAKQCLMGDQRQFPSAHLLLKYSLERAHQSPSLPILPHPGVRGCRLRELLLAYQPTTVRLHLPYEPL